jgi:UDP-galactopyranose mutase
VHLFPSSVDAEHFARARSITEDPPDQARIPRPRLGYCGVIDERMDLPLIRSVAEARPDWQLVMLGPVTKLDPARLPRLGNTHYLGPKGYGELPTYLAGWDVALLPFARNRATRFISPTKTPEYLAAGKPVVSTPIGDVVRPYGEAGLVRIAASTPEFVAEVEAALAEEGSAEGALRRKQADVLLALTSWDRTWAAMNGLIEKLVRGRESGEQLTSRA